MRISHLGPRAAVLTLGLLACEAPEEQTTGDTADTGTSEVDTFHPCDPGPVQHIATGLDSSSAHFGIATHDDGLLTADWVTNQAVRVDLGTDAIAKGFPLSLDQSVGAHGVAYHTDGTFWIADLDGSTVRHYDAQGLQLAHQAVGTQPVNLVPHGTQLLVPDRGEDQLHLLSQADLSVQSSWDIDALDGSQAIGFIDLTVRDDRLYLVSDEFTGVARAGLDGSDQDVLAYDGQAYTGITIVDDEVILGTGHAVVVGDLDGNVSCTWNIEPPSGDNVVYIDVVHVGTRLFAVSWMSDSDLHLAAWEVGAPGL